MVSVCGAACEKCKDFKSKCIGCNALKGKVYWAPYEGSEICSIYNCSVNEKKLNHCGECNKLPCDLYFKTKDPSVSIEEHKIGVDERVRSLKELIS